MPKPLRVSIIATVSIHMIITGEDKPTDGVQTLEDGIRIKRPPSPPPPPHLPLVGHRCQHPPATGPRGGTTGGIVHAPDCAHPT